MPRAQSTRSAAYSTSASTIRVVVVGEVAVVRAATTTTLAMGPLRLCVKRNKKNALPDSGGRRSAQWRERDSPNSSYHLWFHRLTASSQPEASGASCETNPHGTRRSFLLYASNRRFATLPQSSRPNLQILGSRLLEWEIISMWRLNWACRAT